MLRKSLLFHVLAIISVAWQPVFAQTPSDALMMPSREACVLLNYEYGQFDQYWEGSLLRKNETVATVQRQSILPMVAVGITDWLNVYAGLPYVITRSTEPNGGRFAGVNDFQDVTIAAKARFLHQETNSGSLSVLATVAFSAPATNYLSDYRPYSIGNGTPELSYRAIIQYDLNKGMYFRGSGAYVWRGYTKAERDYYYNNGSYFTPWMDVPSAWQYQAVIGKWFLSKSLKAEINYTGQTSTSGDDIRPYNAAQPTNKVNFDQVGINVQYYFPSVKGLGLVASHSRTLNGRNIGKVDAYSLGVTYFFNYLKKQNDAN
jgi:hypothetical protein